MLACNICHTARELPILKIDREVVVRDKMFAAQLTTG